MEISLEPKRNNNEWRMLHHNNQLQCGFKYQKQKAAKSEVFGKIWVRYSTLGTLTTIALSNRYWQNNDLGGFSRERTPCTGAPG